MKNTKTASAGNGLASQESLQTTSKAASAGRAKGKQDAVALLKADHRKVEKLFDAYENADDVKKRDLAREICAELIMHTNLEEEIFYPACREAGVESSDLDEAQVEHDGAKVLIADLVNGSPGDEFYDAKVKVLAEYIKHHVKEEENPRSGIFAQAKKAKADLAALGERLQHRKDQLAARKETLGASPLEARSLHLQDQTTQENAQMPRNYQGNRNHGGFSREENYGTGGRGYSVHGRPEYAGRQDSGHHQHDQDFDRQGNNRGQQSYSGDYDRSAGAYGSSDRGRDADRQHRYSYMSNEDYPDHDRQSRNRWDRDDTTGRNYESQSGSRYSQDENEDYSGSFRTNQGRGGQYDRGQSSQYSQSNYGQSRNQSGYNQGNYNQGGYDQDRFSQSGSGQYGEDDDYGRHSNRNQQSQSRSQGRGQQTSQNRYRDENHDQGYGGSPQRDWDDNDRFTRSTRRNPQYRD